jgi:hypothetical protein
MSETPVLRFPQLNRPFVVITDASQVAAGAVVSQVTEDGDHPVAFASFKFTSTETRYSAIERESLGMVKGVEHFRPYLWGVEFLLRTDHKPLLWVGTLRESSARVTKLKEELAPYTFRLQRTKGSLNVVADCLSRNVNVGESIPQTQEENFAARYLREWTENGPDLAPVEDTPPRGDGSFAVEHLRNWVENGPDLPKVRPPPATLITTPAEDLNIRKWESKDEIVNNKNNQIIARHEEGIAVRQTKSAPVWPTKK